MRRRQGLIRRQGFIRFQGIIRRYQFESVLNHRFISHQRHDIEIDGGGDEAADFHFVKMRGRDRAGKRSGGITIRRVSRCFGIPKLRVTRFTVIPILRTARCYERFGERHKLIQARGEIADFVFGGLEVGEAQEQIEVVLDLDQVNGG